MIAGRRYVCGGLSVEIVEPGRWIGPATYLRMLDTWLGEPLERCPERALAHGRLRGALVDFEGPSGHGWAFAGELGAVQVHCLRSGAEDPDRLHEARMLDLLTCEAVAEQADGLVPVPKPAPASLAACHAMIVDDEADLVQAFVIALCAGQGWPGSVVECTNATRAEGAELGEAWEYCARLLLVDPPRGELKEPRVCTG